MVLLLEGKHEGFAFMLALSSLFIMFLWLQVLVVDLVPTASYSDVRVIAVYTAILGVSAILSWVGNWFWEKQSKVRETSTGLLIASFSLVPVLIGIMIVTSGTITIVTPLTVMAVFTFFVVLTFATAEEAAFRYSLPKVFGGQRSRWTYYGLGFIFSIVFAFLHFAREGVGIPEFALFTAIGMYLCMVFEWTGSFIGISLAHTTWNYLVLGWGITVPVAVILFMFVIVELRGE
jgi:membrane protease YdiL (CAAX protease family)